MWKLKVGDIPPEKLFQTGYHLGWPASDHKKINNILEHVYDRPDDILRIEKEIWWIKTRLTGFHPKFNLIASFGDQKILVRYYNQDGQSEEEWSRLDQGPRLKWIIHRFTGPAVISMRAGPAESYGEQWLIDGRNAADFSILSMNTEYAVTKYLTNHPECFHVVQAWHKAGLLNMSEEFIENVGFATTI